MKDQPEALRLSDALRESHPYPLDIRQAADELRRLAAVEAQRDALLEALKDIISIDGHSALTEAEADEIHARARAAIAAVEGEEA